MNFSTYNESHLHNSLKLLYSEYYQGNIEVPLGKYIYDIITKDGNAIEIQTKNLSHLYNKIDDTIKSGRKIKIIYPVPVVKTIETYNGEGKLLTKRKSPKKGCLYDIFRELTKIYPYVLNENFSLEILEINMTEERLQTPEPVQTKNMKRHYRKNWLKTNKRLDEILSAKTLNTREDYISFLPKSLPKEFCNKDLQLALKSEDLASSQIYKNCNIITWVLLRMNIIRETKIENRKHYFTIQ